MFNITSSENDSSFVSETCHIEGNMISKGNIIMAGLVDGNIETEELTVLDTGSIKGDVKANKIEVDGQINGNIQANNIYLGTNAVIKGDITFFDTLKTEGGVDVDGYIKKTKRIVTKEVQQSKESEIKKKITKPTLVKDIDQAV